MRALPLLAALAACSPAPERIAVEVPSDWRRIEFGGFSIAFPRDRFVDGVDNSCGMPGAPAEGCVLFDEGPVLHYKSDGLTLRSRDPYGEQGPREDWGEPVVLGAVPGHRKALPDGAWRYLVTTVAGGPGSAAVAIWREKARPLIWGRCSGEAGCGTLQRTLASIRFPSAREHCRAMLIRRGAPGAPPPPPGPHALGGRDACARWINDEGETPTR